MKGVWETAGWLAGGHDGAWSVWLANARLASDLVIVATNAYAARVLYLLYRREGARLPGPRLVVLFAALVALCGVSHLVLLLSGGPAPSLVPTALKVAAAGFWVVTAVRLPSVVSGLSAGAPRLFALPPPVDGLDLDGLGLKTAQLRVKARTLENLIRQETWLLDKAEALRELQDILADLEAEQCKI
jgi:hypothetical protein